MQKFSFSVLVLLLSTTFSIFAQSTFGTIHSIMQANCASSGCHDGSNSVFSVTGSVSDVYAALHNTVPVNAAAAAKGNKLVDPGHPYNSFLLRKIGSNGFDAYIQVEDAEKSGHPAVALQNYEIELIRQWIMDGAEETGTIPVSYQLLQDYYTQGGLDFIPVPAAPQASEGFQVRMGPIFLAPQEEFEYMKKEKLHNSELIKVRQANGYMAWESHHMLLFKETGANSSSSGLRRVPFEATPFDGNSVLTAAWQDDGDFVLPEGTALYWQPNTTLDFDYHIKNYSQSEILPADFYLNIMYSEEENPIEMHAELVNNLALVLFQGENTRTATHIPGGGNQERHLYLITSHTHKYGTDYDIFMRNPDGSKGEQIYEGFYNSSYEFNQGFYDWEHPATRYFQELKTFKENEGLIYEVKWNVGEPLVTFGLTTDGEMMLFTYMYTKEKLSQPTGIRDEQIATEPLTVYPNPFSNATELKYNLSQAARVQVEIFDVVGKRIATLLNTEMSAGSHSLTVTEDMLENKAGVYVVTLTVDGSKMSTAKITKL